MILNFFQINPPFSTKVQRIPYATKNLLLLLDAWQLSLAR